MEVILTQDVQQLGRVGTIVKVKDGYARNFLFPRKLAMPVTQGNMKTLERKRAAAEAQFQKRKAEAEALKERLAGINLTMTSLVKEDAEEELYGSISSADIVSGLKEEGLDIDKSAVMMDQPIRKLGIYEVPVQLHLEVTAKVKIWVVKK